MGIFQKFLSSFKVGEGYITLLILVTVFVGIMKLDILSLKTTGWAQQRLADGTLDKMAHLGQLCRVMVYITLIFFEQQSQLTCPFGA